MRLLDWKRLGRLCYSFVQGMTDRVKTRAQAGRISGLGAVRQYFKYSNKHAQKEHRFHYVVVDGSNQTIIVAVDNEPYSKTSLPLAEAAVLTLRKQVA